MRQYYFGLVLVANFSFFLVSSCSSCRVIDILKMMLTRERECE